MDRKIVQEAGFLVMGIGTRTSNAREMAGGGRIAELWGRFFQENVLARIPNKLDGAILAVYTDYSSDQDSEYTLVIGARVASYEQVVPGTVARDVPSGRYAVFQSEKGPADKVVPAVWQKIWSVPKAEPGGDRTFIADFEVYDERAANPQDAQVDVFVGIR